MWRYFLLLLPFFTLHGLLPFVAGLAPGYYGLEAYNEDRELREKGELVEAHITSKTKTGSTYHITYTYIDTTGTEFRDQRDLGQEYNEMVNTNDYFLMTYLPSNPRIHILGDKSSASKSGNLALAGLLAAFLLCGWGLWGIARTIWKMVELRFLFKKGNTGNAIVGEWIKSPGKQGRSKDQMTFHWVAANGRWYEGRSRSFTYRVQQQWPKGAHIKVAYDPIHPTRCEPDVYKILK